MSDTETETPEPEAPEPSDDPEAAERHDVNQEMAEQFGGYRSSDFVFRSAEGEVGILEGRLLPYGVWARIDSFVEGRFYERFQPRSLTKALSEKIGRLPILFEHGLSPMLGKMTIAEFEGFREEQDGVHYRARLLTGLPDLLMEGLRRGQYGSSIKHKPVNQDINHRPGKSAHNPEGWQERSVRESMVKEFSVVTFPAYEGATAVARSLTDDFYAMRALEHPELLLQHIRAQVEPTHSEPAAEEAPPADTGSRATLPKPTRDWLSTEKEARPSWHLP